MLALVGTFFVAAVLCAATGARLGSRVFAFVAAPMVATATWLALESSGVLDGSPVSETLDWVGGTGGLTLSLKFRLDGFGLLMAALVSGIGLLVAVYSVSYFAEPHEPHEPHEPDGHLSPVREVGAHPKINLGVFSAALVAFAGSMLGLVLANDIVTLFVFWELTSITSFFLIGINDHDTAARQAALRALLVTGGGGLALLAGLVMLSQQAGTTEIS
ncbi:MAG: hypothetical protein LH616_09470, partial [Ilumatobacteraceae bacterium]|nr:hypothetical protein [Ilumatobacteraceae bacterium]